MLKWDLDFTLCDTPIHQFNFPVPNNQGATELDSRVKNLSSSLYMRNFYFNLLMFVIN